MEATRRVLELYQGRSAPKIIAMTANVHAEVRKECLDNGMCGFLSKPVTIKDMERCLIDLFGTSSQ